MRCAVVGHVEWTEFALVDHVPAAGQIAHAMSHWAGPAGGGSVIAAQTRKLAGACDLISLKDTVAGTHARRLFNQALGTSTR